MEISTGCLFSDTFLLMITKSVGPEVLLGLTFFSLFTGLTSKCNLAIFDSLIDN
jgi:hypothetical protein